MSNGFGFSFPNDDNEGRDNEGNNNDNGRGDANNPFAAFGFGRSFGSGQGFGAQGGQGQGGLGDILNQFGQMLSGMGSSMNNRDESDAVNFDLAARMARQRIAGVTSVSAADTTAHGKGSS